MKTSRKKVYSTVRKNLRKPQMFCPLIRGNVANLGDYFNILNSTISDDAIFWYRGHADTSWSLTPSALRYNTLEKRNIALSLIAGFKRYSELKLDKLPLKDEELGWIQLAQHYGLPSRLLDWTQNAAIALYFSCYDCPDEDGAVYLLNPIELNINTDRKNPRIFDPHIDSSLIKTYLKLTGKQVANGAKRTIAINPVWNSQRVMLQQGVFTLHGSKNFSLDWEDASSLVYLIIRKQYKEKLLIELHRVGIHEMSIFPEIEHVCNYLKTNAKLA